jgi:hypothetical protein
VLASGDVVEENEQVRVKLLEHDHHFHLPIDASSPAAMGANADTVFETTVEGDRLILSLVNSEHAQGEEQLMDKLERDNHAMFKRLVD